MSLEVVAIGLTLLVHILGAIVLVWALLDGEQVDWRGAVWPRDDDGGGGPGDEPPLDDGGPGGGGVALPPFPPDAVPSAVRLREPGRIGEAYPRPQRRPAHPPQRTPAHEPEPAQR